MIPICAEQVAAYIAPLEFFPPFASVSEVRRGKYLVKYIGAKSVSVFLKFLYINLFTFYKVKNTISLLKVNEKTV